MGVRQILIAADQLMNAVLGGYADETISARAWRKQDQSRLWAAVRRVVDAAARIFGQSDHCRVAYVLEVQRRQLPPEYRHHN